MKVFQHVNIVTCDQDFHVYLDGILAVKDSQIVYVGQEKSEILEQAEQIIDYQGAWIMPTCPAPKMIIFILFSPQPKVGCQFQLNLDRTLMPQYGDK